MRVSRTFSIIALGALLFLAACGGTNQPPDDSGPYLLSQKLMASDGAVDDHFGFVESIAVQGDQLIVGAHNRNGRTGRAYVYEL